MYGATKAALERITTGLAAEVCDDGIAVNSLAPVAAVRTPGAEVHLGPLLDERPDIVEPIELLVDATARARHLRSCDHDRPRRVLAPVPDRARPLRQR